MRRKMIYMALLLFALLPFSGMGACGDDSGGGGTTCQSACERANRDCGDGDDCSVVCSAFTTQASASGCESSLEAYIGCANTTADLCAQGACKPEQGVFIDCVTSYCAGEPTADICQK